MNNIDIEFYNPSCTARFIDDEGNELHPLKHVEFSNGVDYYELEGGLSVLSDEHKSHVPEGRRGSSASTKMCKLVHLVLKTSQSC